ncbi:hypothetical protein [Streptomyces sp. NPDC053720]|uniref:hypothetical protein n=1 Tax=Streptomyces sp. NPDC053720 TaxID=3154855 RepID=UPI003426B585
MEKTVTSHYGCLRTAHQTTHQPEEPQPPEGPDGMLDVRDRPRRMVATIHERHRLVQELLAQGRSLRWISRDLDLDYYAVRRYARTADVGELLVKVTSAGPCWTTSKPYIHQRFTQRCHNASQLHREICDQGFPGDRSVVNSYVRLLKQGTITAPPPLVEHLELRPGRRPGDQGQS